MAPRAAKVTHTRADRQSFTREITSNPSKKKKRKKNPIRHTGFAQTRPESLERFPKQAAVMMLLTGSAGEQD